MKASKSGRAEDKNAPESLGNEATLRFRSDPTSVELIPLESPRVRRSVLKSRPMLVLLCGAAAVFLGSNVYLMTKPSAVSPDNSTPNPSAAPLIQQAPETNLPNSKSERTPETMAAIIETIPPPEPTLAPTPVPTQMPPEDPAPLLAPKQEPTSKPKPKPTQKPKKTLTPKETPKPKKQAKPIQTRIGQAQPKQESPTDNAPKAARQPMMPAVSQKEATASRPAGAAETPCMATPRPSMVKKTPFE